ncbi:MAG: hypothetical protein GEV11_18030 [Streptosporangiales bacterium]|nr:hypothetical protein [Streptosporangiales bacterium]
MTRAPDVWTLVFPVPSAASGTLRLRVAYAVTGSARAPEVPLYVPAYPGAGTRAVRLVYRVPAGRSVLGDPFPVVPRPGSPRC